MKEQIKPTEPKGSRRKTLKVVCLRRVQNKLNMDPSKKKGEENLDDIYLEFFFLGPKVNK